jgi:threonine/homoserine/homoserine lactone efflux protein
VGGVQFSAIAAFWAVSILFILTPGADWAYAITAGLRRRTFPAVTGMLLGHLLAATVVAVGVGAIVVERPMLLTVITVAGAFYLVWLGVQTFRHAAVPHAGGDVSTVPPRRWLIQGFGVSGLNPKVILLFLALLPQFVVTGVGWPVAVQVMVLGLVHIVSCAAVYTGVSVGGRVVLGARPAAARVVSRVSGALMIVIGVFLVAEGMLM